MTKDAKLAAIKVATQIEAIVHELYEDENGDWNITLDDIKDLSRLAGIFMGIITNEKVIDE